MNEHTAVHNCLPMGRGLWEFVIHNWHVIRHDVIGLLQVHLTCELLAHLVQRFRGPVPEPVQHTPEKDAPVSCSSRGLGMPGKKSAVTTLSPADVSAPVEKCRGGGRAVLEPLGGWVHGEDDVQVADDLAGEPLVQLLVRVQHQALLLGPLFALGHQSGVLVSFEEAGDLTNERALRSTGPGNLTPLTCSTMQHGAYLPVGQKGIHSLQESRI